ATGEAHVSRHHPRHDVGAAHLLRDRVAVHQRVHPISRERDGRNPLHRRDDGTDRSIAHFSARGILGDAHSAYRTTMRYPREKLFFVCTGPRCNNPDRGEERGEVIREDLKALNKSLGRKAVARVCTTSCLDLCDFGPNMIVEPDDRVYSHLTRHLAKVVYEGPMG